MDPKQPKDVGGVPHWQCSTCEQWLPASAYYADKRTPNGLKAQCKACHTEGSMRTRDATLHRATRRKSAAKQRAAHPERFRAIERKRPRRSGPKVAARQIVHLALRIGAIKRPEVCEECGERKRLTAHHHDYQKPLNVEWLCYLCHAQRHR